MLINLINDITIMESRMQNDNFIKKVLNLTCWKSSQLFFKDVLRPIALVGR